MANIPGVTLDLGNQTKILEDVLKSRIMSQNGCSDKLIGVFLFSLLVCEVGSQFSSMSRKRLIVFAIIIGCTIFTYTVLKRIWHIYQSGNRLAREQQQVIDLEKENESLRMQLEQVDSPAFLEKEARDKLNLARPNEIAVILPQPQASDSANQVAVLTGGNWSRWWHLFFDTM